MVLHRTNLAVLAAACLVGSLAACDDGGDGGAVPATDVQEDTTPGDVTGDADEDVEDGEPLLLEAAVITSECTDHCDDIESECGSLGDLGADQAACVSLCEERAGEDGWWLGSYGCMSDACDADVCFAGDGPVSPHAGCAEACPLLDQCDALGFVELPEDQPDVCLAACSGASISDEDFDEGLECLTTGLAGGCEDAEEVVQSCLVDLCPVVCEEFLTPAGDEACAPDDAIFDTWADVEACEAACGTLTPSQKPRLFGCLLSQDCGDPTPCLGVPEEDEPACTDGCAELFTVCEGPVDEIPTPALCASFCTGLLTGIGSPATNPDAGTCVAALESCPAGDGAFQTLLACALEPSEACGAVCDAVATCNPADPAARPECLFGCFQVEQQSPAIVDGVRQCIEAAGDDCQAVQECIPEE